MNNKKSYQKPEMTLIKVETEGEVFALSGVSPGKDNNPGGIGIEGNSSFFSRNKNVLKED